MIGTQNSQISILDGALNTRSKRSRSDALLAKLAEAVDWQKLTEVSRVVFTDTKRGRPTIPVEFSLKCLLLQYLYGFVRTRYVTERRNDLHFTFLCMIHNIRRAIALQPIPV